MLCIKCREPIESRKDLVVVNRSVYSLVPYHKECLTKAFEEAKGYVGRPVNTLTSTISLGVIMLVALIFYLMSPDILLLLVLFISPISRIIVWLRFERLLKR